MNRIARRMRRLLRRDEGQAGFEFLLMLPVFFLFFLLLIDFGVSMYEFVSATNAVREGARFGAVNCSDGSCTAAEIKSKVVAKSGGTLSNTGEVTVAWPSGVNRGDPVAVKVSHVHSLIFFPYTWTITACSDMRLEQQDSSATSGGSGC
ncbi:MAG: pilus assembly protein [Chloroflexi bacterium]|nr:pilus assembly protein [Chloroflexota bacterium]